jgi:hypothetical protein
MTGYLFCPLDYVDFSDSYLVMEKPANGHANEQPESCDKEEIPVIASHVFHQRAI